MRDVNTGNSITAINSGFAETAEYTILADEKMFSILLQGLYSDKPRALIRELCSNALDSHAMAGCPDRPFKVVIPTRWDTTFMVQDYGVSLSHEDVMRLYTTVGASTKNDDNITVGKFGLGSKVPFAYTDNFTVTAVLNGEKRVYNAYKDKNKPKLSLIIREPTNEENGLSVSFPAKEYDVPAFQAAARRVLSVFDVIPENNIELTKANLQVAFEGKGWKIVKRDAYHGIDGVMVKQGCVIYPVDSRAIQANSRCAAFELLHDEAIMLDMPIGSVDITPSRESLSYDPTTIKNIREVMDQIAPDVLGKLTKNVTNAKTLWEATKELCNIQTNTSYQLFNKIQYAARFDGKVIQPRIIVDEKSFDKLYRSGLHVSKVEGSSKNNTKIGRQHIIRYGFTVSPAKNYPLTFLYSKSDNTKHLKYKLGAAYFNLNYNGNLYFIDKFNPNSIAAKRLLVLLGRPPVNNEEEIKFIDIDTIEFTLPEKQKMKRIVGLNDFVLHRKRFEKIFQEDQTAYINGRNVYYIPTYDSVARGEYLRSDSRLGDVMTTLFNNKLFSPDKDILVGIPASVFKKFSIPSDWKNIEEAALEMLAPLVNPYEICKANESYKLTNGGKLKQWFSFLNWLNKQHFVTDSTVIDSARNSYNEIIKIQGEDKLKTDIVGTLSKLLSETEYDYLFNKAEEQAKTWKRNVRKEFVNLSNRYPMVGITMSHYSKITYTSREFGDYLTKEEMADIKNYINMVDVQKTA